MRRPEDPATHRVGLADVLSDVRRRAGSRAPALVGVDGPSGSGKSTMARRLAALAGAPVVEVDEFWTWSDDPAWWDYFVGNVLAPLADGRDARFRARNWATDTAGVASGDWVTTRAAPIVVVEGVSSTRRTVAERYAYRIWVDAAEGTRLRRGLARDGAEHRDTWLEWLATERDFFARDDTPARAHLRVCGEPTVSHDPAAEVLVRDDR